MPLVNVVLTLIVVGVLLWLVNRYVPMQGAIKGILNAVVVIVVVLWVLNVFGLYHYVTQFHVGPRVGRAGSGNPGPQPVPIPAQARMAGRSG